jgi:sugar O-acyltransferase (sialic acid O-acetyltransferase NeuD family)
VSRLLILGAGGHGKVVADIAIESGRWNSISFLDDKEDLRKVMGFPVIGRLEDYKSLKEKFEFVFVAIGNNGLRLDWLNRLISENFKIPIIIHRFSSISKDVEIENGSVIMPGVIVNTDTRIGKGCILNTGCSIDHDCVLGDGVHISPGVNIGGTVTIGPKSWLGIGSSISNNIFIGQKSIIAAGAVVTKDIPENVTVAGIPARIINNG